VCGCPVTGSSAPPSSVVKCLWGVFVRGFGVLFLSCVGVGVGGVVLCRCVCDLLIFLLVADKGVRSNQTCVRRGCTAGGCARAVLVWGGVSRG